MRPLLVLACLLGAAYAMAPEVTYMIRSMDYSLEASPTKEGLVEKRGVCSTNTGSCKMSKADQKKYVAAHNKYRSQEGISTKLVWSDALALQAEKLLNGQSGCKMHHDLLQCGSDRLGQNLIWDSASKAPKGNMNPDKVVKSWYDEVKNYNKGSKTCNSGKVCGHFTQVIWKGTTKVGCAAKICGNEREVACDYFPAGNMRGDTPWTG